MEICEFMVIDKEDFNLLGLKQIFEREYQERRAFFTSLSTELKFSRIAINRLANESKVLNFNILILPVGSHSSTML